MLLQIAKMAERSFADHVLLPVTAAIYRNGEEKPAMMCHTNRTSHATSVLFFLIFFWEKIEGGVAGKRI